MSLITDIQKYSIHDGDGIRTTVFFKGCRLKCVWCHNPEAQSYRGELLFDAEKCVGCSACTAACPSGAIILSERKGENSSTDMAYMAATEDSRRYARTDRTLCTACGKCVDYCNLNLREIAGKEYTVDELVKELKKDEMFYEESGGGVTLSGGEVMTADMDFVEQLVRKLDRIGISVFIDTCGQAPYENFERILPYVDTFLYDIKTVDSDLHRKYMGAGNELILENLKKLNRAGARIYIRIPVIWEVNGSEVSVRAIISYLQEKQIHAARVNLLPYHNTGAGKYARLGKGYEGTALHAPAEEDMEKFVQIFREAGFSDVRIGG